MDRISTNGKDSLMGKESFKSSNSKDQQLDNAYTKSIRSESGYSQKPSLKSNTGKNEQLLNGSIKSAKSGVEILDKGSVKSAKSTKEQMEKGSVKSAKSAGEQIEQGSVKSAKSAREQIEQGSVKSRKSDLGQPDKVSIKSSKSLGERVEEGSLKSARSKVKQVDKGSVKSANSTENLLEKGSVKSSRGMQEIIEKKTVKSEKSEGDPLEGHLQVEVDLTDDMKDRMENGSAKHSLLVRSEPKSGNSIPPKIVITASIEGQGEDNVPQEPFISGKGDFRPTSASSKHKAQFSSFFSSVSKWATSLHENTEDSFKSLDPLAQLKAKKEKLQEQASKMGNFLGSNVLDASVFQGVTSAANKWLATPQDHDVFIEDDEEGEEEVDFVKKMKHLEPELEEGGKRNCGYTVHRGEDDGLGNLEFVLKYNVRRAILKIIICRATNLVAVDVSGASDPYVTIHFQPERPTTPLFSTSVRQATLKPMWNETFVYKGFLNSELKHYTLSLKINDYNSFGKHSSLGMVQFPLNKLYKKIGPSLPGEIVESKSMGTSTSYLSTQSSNVILSKKSKKSLLHAGSSYKSRFSSNKASKKSKKTKSIKSFDSKSSTAQNSTSSKLQHIEEESIHSKSHSLETNDHEDNVSGIDVPDRDEVLSERQGSSAKSTSHKSNGHISNSHKSSELKSSLEPQDKDGVEDTALETMEEFIDERESHKDQSISENEARSSNYKLSIAKLDIPDSDDDIPENERPCIIRQIVCNRNIKPVPSNKPAYGKLQIAILYQRDREILSVQIVKASRVYNPKGKPLSVYVCVALSRIGAKRETKLNEFRTSLREKVPNPVWNEVFKFDVAFEYLGCTVVDITILDTSMQLMKDKTLGALRLGMKSNPYLRSQWELMVQREGMLVYSWHVIKK